MAFDITSFLGGGLLVLILIVLAVLILISLVLGKFKDKVKYVLGKLFTRTSLMLIAIFDVVAAFEPTQVLGGIPLAAITAGAVFISEFGIHEKWNVKKIILCLVLALVGGSIVLVPTPIAGLFVAWFGVVGDKKRK
jgi:hypothetical protein